MAKGLWVVLNVDNVEKSAEFYKSLGFKARIETIDMPGMPAASMGSIDCGGSGLVLWNKNVVPENQPADTKAWVSGELGKGVLFSVGVPNAEKVWAKAQNVRAEVEQPLAKQPWGGQEFTIIDLDGYVINVTDKFPGASPPKKAKKTVKKVATKAKSTARKVVGKAKRK